MLRASVSAALWATSPAALAISDAAVCRSVAIDARSDSELATLASRQDRLLEAYKAAFQKPDDFASVTSGTGDMNKVVTRFAALDSVLAEVLQ